MNGEDVIKIIEKAFNCIHSEESVHYTEDEYKDLENHLIGMMPDDLLHFLPSILINFINEVDAQKDVSWRVNDLIDTLDIGFDVKSERMWDAYYLKIGLEDTFLIINDEQSAAIASWLVFIEESYQKDEDKYPWISIKRIGDIRKYWEDRSKGLIKSSSRPSLNKGDNIGDSINPIL